MNKTKKRIKAGALYVWNHPLILAPFLLILAILLFNEVRTQAFKPYLNCNYLLGAGINFHEKFFDRTWTSIFCDGFPILGINVPGVARLINPVLEFIRTAAVWAILLFFAFMSLLLTLTINNFKTIVRIVTLNREEWKRFGASLVTFLLFFVVFCTLFYFNVMNPDFLNIRMPGR